MASKVIFSSESDVSVVGPELQARLDTRGFVRDSRPILPILGVQRGEHRVLSPKPGPGGVYRAAALLRPPGPVPTSRVTDRALCRQHFLSLGSRSISQARPG